jgi:hypothetical protein
MGTTNFLQWNPTKNNQETDIAYEADSQRVDGAQLDAIFASILANKLFYQLATFVAAFGQMMANKGYTMSDADFPTLVATLTHVLTSMDLKAYAVTVPYSAAPVFDCSQLNPAGGVFFITLNGNATPTIVNPTAGQRITFAIVQDGIGGHVWTWPPGVTGSDLNPAANSYNVQSFIIGTGLGVRTMTPMVQG